MYDMYFILKRIEEKHDFNTIEEAHLYQILSELRGGKKISASKIWKNLEAEKNKFEIDEGYYGPKLPKWYTSQFYDVKNLKEFLSTNDCILNIGYYDVEGEVFERKKPKYLSDETIVVDGSNVAWNAGDRGKGDKPYAKNIQLMIEELNKDFEKIKVVVDANLKHEIPDKKVFNKLLAEEILKEVPSSTEADEFIIKYAKEKSARIITLDRFRDWKEKDKWVEDHIDEYLVKFMIEDDVVKIYLE